MKLLTTVRTAVLACALCGVTAARGGTVTWDGGGADDNWSTPENWSGDTLPGATDDVVFDATSTKDCTVDVTVTVGNITLASGYSTGAVTQAADVDVHCGIMTLNAGWWVMNQGADLHVRGTGAVFVMGGGVLQAFGDPRGALWLETDTGGSTVNVQGGDYGGATVRWATIGAISATFLLQGNISGA